MRLIFAPFTADRTAATYSLTTDNYSDTSDAEGSAQKIRRSEDHKGHKDPNPVGNLLICFRVISKRLTPRGCPSFAFRNS